MNLGLLGSSRLRRWSCVHFLVGLFVPLMASAGAPTAKTYTFKTLDSPTNQLQADVDIAARTYREVVALLEQHRKR